MTRLSELSDDELKAEVERRQQIKKQALIPKPLAKMNFDKLVETCTDYIISIVKEQYDDEDYRHFIYEAAMQAVFGDDIFERKLRLLEQP